MLDRRGRTLHAAQYPQRTYDADFNAANDLLAGISAQPTDGPSLRQQTTVYRQTLSLLLAVQRPTAFLSQAREALDARC
ncbi:MAG: hypothetical protein AB7N65_16075 [Vicinamibacterales bacterium]